MIATNGNTSYAIFTYWCGGLNWTRTNSATIGFSTGPNLYANHELSLTANVNDIACLNYPNNEWSNVVYYIGGGKITVNVS